jgi:hypothetical protein
MLTNMMHGIIYIHISPRKHSDSVEHTAWGTFFIWSFNTNEFEITIILQNYRALHKNLHLAWDVNMHLICAVIHLGICFKFL